MWASQHCCLASRAMVDWIVCLNDCRCCLFGKTDEFFCPSVSLTSESKQSIWNWFAESLVRGTWLTPRPACERHLTLFFATRIACCNQRLRLNNTKTRTFLLSTGVWQATSSRRRFLVAYSYRMTNVIFIRINCNRFYIHRNRRCSLFMVFLMRWKCDWYDFVRGISQWFVIRSAQASAAFPPTQLIS